MLTALMLLASCTGRQTKTEEGEEFNYFVDQFEDMRVFRYRLPGFESLSYVRKNSFTTSVKLPCAEGISCGTRTLNIIF